MESFSTTTDYINKCKVCERINSFNIYDTLYGCDHCFHISSLGNDNGMDNVCKVDMGMLFNDMDRYYEYILSELQELSISGDKYQVLVINDRNTLLIDKIRDILCKKISKYNVKTVSVSMYYNNSFFSSHCHYKHNFSDYITDVLRDQYGYFDLIILNDTLMYSGDLDDKMSFCKRLVNDKSVLYGFNLHKYIIYSMKLFQINKCIRNIFNTNSLKTLCERLDFNLHYVDINDNTWMFYKINCCKAVKIDKQIVDVLYEEMTQNIYDVDYYNYINNYWTQYISSIRNTLIKYKSIDYTVVIINSIQRDLQYISLECDYYIETRCVSQIEEMNNLKTLIVILDYSCIDRILDEIKSLSKEKSYLIFDIKHMIAYNL